MEPAGQLAKLGQGERQLLGGGRQRRAGGGGVAVERTLRDPQGERERDQALLRAVVQVALEAAAIETGTTVPSLRSRSVS